VYQRRGKGMSRSRTARTRILPPLNGGDPLSVVRLPDGRLAIPDANSNRVWVERAMVSELQRGLNKMPVVEVPSIPSGYGEWQTKSIGGVSLTERRIDIVRATNTRECLTLFAIQSPTSTSVSDILALRGVPSEMASIVSQNEEEEFGHTTEILIKNYNDVHFIAALVARAGGKPMLEDASMEAMRPIGIERLDRIESHSIAAHDQREVEEGDAYGCRRGGENWKFDWMPTGSHLPLTWDLMVQNIPSDVALRDLPSPLRQHVARYRLDNFQYESIGSQWVERPALTPEQVETCPMWDLLQDPPTSFLQALETGRTEFSKEEVAEWNLNNIDPDRILVRLPSNGRCFRPVDTRRPLTKWIPTVREVSAALRPAQSHQLIEAFYLLAIERIEGPPDVIHALQLILFRYMFERGYTARWMGKYTQDASHVGNGDKFRKFLKLRQYRPDLLPAKIINKLCHTNGRLQGKGSKGSRSKYIDKHSGKKKYRPTHRFERSEEEEKRMRSGN